MSDVYDLGGWKDFAAVFGPTVNVRQVRSWAREAIDPMPVESYDRFKHPRGYRADVLAWGKRFGIIPP